MSQVTLTFRYYTLDRDDDQSEEEDLALGQNNDQQFAADEEAISTTYIFRKEGSQLLVNGQLMGIKLQKSELDEAELIIYNGLPGENDGERAFIASLQHSLENISGENSEDFYSAAPVSELTDLVLWAFFNDDERFQNAEIVIDNHYQVKINDKEWRSMPTTGSGMIGWDVNTLVN